jgi:putative ABC transport system permease protein
MPGRIVSLFRNLLRKNASEQALDEELQSSVELLTEEKVKEGLSPAVARRQALMELGGMEQVKEEVRAIRAGHILEDFARDVRFAFRQLTKSPGFTAVTVITIALGIGANTAIFAIVNSVLLRPLPGPNAGAIVLMSNLYPNAGVVYQTESSAPDYYDRLSNVTALEEQAMFRQIDLTLEINGVPEQVRGMGVTPSFFNLVEIAPCYGRAFDASEGEVGADRKVILSYALWRQIYGGDTSAVGRQIRLGGLPLTIVGVMPREFVFVNPEVRFWVPLTFTQEQKTQYHNNNWSNIGRLKPGATIAQVQAQVDALNAANLERFPQFKDILVQAGFYTKVEPLQQMLVRDVKEGLYLLWGGAVLVVLIGGLNIANLAIARWSARRKEIATRLAIGASRAQIARQLIVENGLLSIAGGVIGLALGQGSLAALSVAGLDRFPRAYEVHIDWIVVLVGLGIAVALGVLVALAPLASVFKVDVNSMLRSGARTGGTGIPARRRRQTLVGAEVGFAFVLLVGTGLLLASFRHLLAVDPGFTRAGVLTASMSVPSSKYPSGAGLRQLVSRSLEAIRSVPGVASAGVTTRIPFGGEYDDSIILAEGYINKPGESVISPRRLVVTPGYFETMKIGLIRGRYFVERDTESAPGVVIVDEQLARHFWPNPNEDPIGRRMYQPDNPANPTVTDANTRWYRVVGVVRSVRLEDLAGSRSAFGAYYFPYAENPSRTYTFAVRASHDGDMGAVTRAMRQAVAQIDPELALFDIKSMQERAELSMSSRRTSLTLATIYGGLALFLSAIGIYGVLAYLVTQRRREIGIRVALGSTSAGIVGFVLRECLMLVAVGLALGLVGAIAMRRLIASQLYDVHPLDPLVIGGVSLLLGTTALAACVVPSRRASRVDPMVVLHEE